MATLEEQIAAVAAAETGVLPTASSGVVAVQSDDAASSQAVPIISENRINQASEVVGNDIVDGKQLTNAETQSTPPIDINNTEPTAPTEAGAAAGNDDSVKPSKNATQTEIDNVFNTGTITPQANVLDQYSSYTYQASVYLMKPEAFAAMVKSRKRSIAGSQLLFQSGGAPVNGRNPYFSNDYYIEKFELKSTITGKGTNAAHNVSEIKMTVIEPNGITLIENLDKAVTEYLGNAGDKKKNFQAQLFLLVVRFYGYDENGNLITPNSNANQAPNQATPSIAFVEKYYPFCLNKLEFKIANKLVEYEISATACQFQTNVGQARGQIPYNVELSGVTVKDALLGPAVTGTTSTTTGAAATTTTRDEATTESPGTTAPEAPPKANAAPTPKLTIKQGLITAMNQYQKDLVTQGIYGVADEYEIEFVTNAIESAKIQKPGGTKDSTSSPTGGTAADQKLPEKQSVDNNSRILTATAGKSLVQFLDEVVRYSSFIQEQQKIQVLESDGKVVPNGAAKNLAWYKIGLRSVPIKYDAKRNDYAYKMTYVIHPYKVSEIVSSYFSKPKFPGHHKQYNYWFTGQNTQIISYEQTYNALYYMPKTGGVNDSSAGANENVKLTFAPNSAQTSQGAKGKVNEPAANAADYLYSPGDNGTASLTIIGDPAWLQQGELTFGTSKNSFSFAPFLPDGTINFDSGQILFEIVFNTPSDYNLNTGLIDPNQQTQNTTPQAGQTTQKKNRSLSYIANQCTSLFEKGKFTQTLTGTRVNYSPGQVAATNADTKRIGTTAEPEASRQGSVDRTDPIEGNPTGADPNNDTKINSTTGIETEQPSDQAVESNTQTPPGTPVATPTPADNREPATSDGVVLPNPGFVAPPAAGVVVYADTSAPVQLAATSSLSGTTAQALAEGRLVVYGDTDTVVNTKPQQLIVKEA